MTGDLSCPSVGHCW